MAALPTELRRDLERAVLQAREAAERGAEAALRVLAVDADRPFDTLRAEQTAQRRALRVRMRSLAATDIAHRGKPGDPPRGFQTLVEEVAYEQWHRMLFARFLAENDLLIHPKHGIAISLEECAELAQAEGEPDEWMVAAKFAGEMLPGIFRRDDPAVQVRFASNDRTELERVLKALTSRVFQADDALGWVYQFWQTRAKDEVNRSGRKVGGKDLAAVTQLFTEHYMVRFLLENSLGAWWAARHPESALVSQWDYLRFRDDGNPAAGTFSGWPDHARDVTVMDPCGGSGHLLAGAADMLRQMRMEEEGLSKAQAAEAVLRDNLFGLEIDPRCTQLAAFALVFDAWKAGLDPKKTVVPNVACSGIAVGGQLEDWKRLAGDDANLQYTLERLYELFQNAPDLGSLINPSALSPLDQLFTSRYEQVGPLLQRALARSGEDPAAAVFGATAEGVERAGLLLARQYTLVTTNVPYLTRVKQDATLKHFLEVSYPEGRGDLATAFVLRCRAFTGQGGTYAMVTPQNWLFLTSYRKLRELLLGSQRLCHLSRLGEGAFESAAAAGAFTLLSILQNRNPIESDEVTTIDASGPRTPGGKAQALKTLQITYVNQLAQLRNPDARFAQVDMSQSHNLLSSYATAAHGLGTKDADRFVRCFWEIAGLDRRWVRHQSSVRSTKEFGGLEHILLWEQGRGALFRWIEEWKLVGWTSGVWRAGTQVWNKPGVVVSQMRNLCVALYAQASFDNNTAAIVPRDPGHLSAIWAFCSSPEFTKAVRRIDQKLNVTNSTLVKVPFDLEHWQKKAEESYPNGLPVPHSDDPTQWLFKGNILGSEAPLQVAVARLLGYRWPEQVPDLLDSVRDEDGIVCIPALASEQEAAERLRSLLASAYGEAWSVGTLDQLLADVGYKDKSLEQWLRDGFFEQFCKLFHHCPFIWQIWDGRRDGFSALVNCHKLDGAKLQKLAYTYLGEWIERQREEKSRGIAGADDRLAAAQALQQKLALILRGEPPFDICLRWKKLHEQPIGWAPDLDDGVRLNIRPFMTAGVLRWKPNIKWEKDRGKNPDGSDRINDLHFTNAEKQEARRKAGVPV